MACSLHEQNAALNAAKTVSQHRAMIWFGSIALKRKMAGQSTIAGLMSPVAPSPRRLKRPMFCEIK